MKKSCAAVIGTVIGPIVIGVKVLYALKYYTPEIHPISPVGSLSSAGLFAERPLVWIAFGLPFGAIIGVTISIVLNYLSHYQLARWPVINGALGAILGWCTVVMFVILHFLIFTIVLVFKSLVTEIIDEKTLGMIAGMNLAFLLGIYELLVPGAIVGAIVGFFLKRGEGGLPVRE